MDALIEIQKKYLTFSKGEKKIADYLLSHSDQINNMNINELSTKTATSNASITRFVQKMGYKKYADLKLAINHSTAVDPSNNTNKVEIIDEVFLFYQKVIQKTQKFIKQDDLEKFYHLLKNHKNIIVIGSSNPGATGKTFSLRLTRMGLNSKAYMDPVWMLMRASIASSDDLFLAISNSGVTTCIVRTLQKAKEKGATIISITSYLENPVAQLSQLTFHVYNTRFVNHEKFIDSQFANMYFIDVLTTYLQKDETFKKNMLTTREVINDV